jgi:hypothetical protein
MEWPQESCRDDFDRRDQHDGQDQPDRELESSLHRGKCITDWTFLRRVSPQPCFLPAQGDPAHWMKVIYAQVYGYAVDDPRLVEMLAGDKRDAR